MLWVCDVNFEVISQEWKGWEESGAISIWVRSSLCISLWQICHKGTLISKSWTFLSLSTIIHQGPVTVRWFNCHGGALCSLTQQGLKKKPPLSSRRKRTLVKILCLLHLFLFYSVNWILRLDMQSLYKKCMLRKWNKNKLCLMETHTWKFGFELG